jgi:hypothetical protein
MAGPQVQIMVVLVMLPFFLLLVIPAEDTGQLGMFNLKLVVLEALGAVAVLVVLERVVLELRAKVMTGA